LPGVVSNRPVAIAHATDRPLARRSSASSAVDVGSASSSVIRGPRNRGPTSVRRLRHDPAINRQAGRQPASSRQPHRPTPIILLAPGCRRALRHTPRPRAHPSLSSLSQLTTRWPRCLADDRDANILGPRPA